MHRIQKRTYERQDGSTETINEWQVRVSHNCRREWFSLGSNNKIFAAKRAAAIYQSLKINGWDETIRQFKGEKYEKVKVISLGEYLKAVENRANLNPKTFTTYCRKLRTLVADIKGIPQTKERYDHFHKHHLKWREAVDKTPLGYLAADRIRKWQKSEIAKAQHDPVKIRKAEHTANSIVRNARSLFSPKITGLLKEMELPNPLPFADVEMLKSSSMRYRSQIDVGELVTAAETELPPKYPEQYKIFLLSLFAGLRRNEIDKLLWESVDAVRGEIVIAPHTFFSVKTETSIGAVPVDPGLLKILETFKEKATGSFVIESKVPPKMDKDYAHYRANAHFRKLSAWLRSKGITAQSPIHTLRKEYGRLLTEKFGIYAASKALRHAGIQITAAHYADDTRRNIISINDVHATPAPSPQMNDSA
ncbi:tyrosine-type recombinase/integrase [Ruficoccus amylovorans]|uniref:Tyrosine-type recombinase/integrase n=1 Tax=Ruficoccus amylovorans TaxID=1804625 RepID=A0A842HJ04_9BACT|nr:tyrosine-type recombinase/integrase [Ruficoccus amylovorans]MBC2595487.1 tyrosine-type recombinase/integrase [Ruficoccus amylovorans]